MKKVIFASGQGSGYISKDNIIEERFEQKEAVFDFGTIAFDEKTDLGGFFINKVEYKGRDDNELLFYLGEDEGVHYYQSMFLITEKRIFLKYAYDSGRDYRFRGGEWK